MDRIRYSVSGVFVVIAICAIIFAVPSFVPLGIFNGRRAIQSLISDCEGVEFVGYDFYNDGGLEKIVSVRLRIEGRPDSHLSLGGLELHRQGRLKHVFLREIGPFKFIVGEGDPNDSTSPPKMISYTRSIDLGAESETPELTPLEVTTLSEVLENYDALLEHFSQWPEKKSPGLLKRNGKTYVYYRKEAADGTRAGPLSVEQGQATVPADDLGSSLDIGLNVSFSPPRNRFSTSSPVAIAAESDRRYYRQSAA